jgi:hypothetical protein
MEWSNTSDMCIKFLFKVLFSWKKTLIFLSAERKHWMNWPCSVFVVLMLLRFIPEIFRDKRKIDIEFFQLTVESTSDLDIGKRFVLQINRTQLVSVHFFCLLNDNLNLWVLFSFVSFNLKNRINYLSFRDYTASFYIFSCAHKTWMSNKSWRMLVKTSEKVGSC